MMAQRKNENIPLKSINFVLSVCQRLCVQNVCSVIPFSFGDLQALFNVYLCVAVYICIRRDGLIGRKRAEWRIRSEGSRSTDIEEDHLR